MCCVVLRALNMSTQQCECKAAAKARLTKALNAAALAQVGCCGGSCCALCEVQNVLHKVCWAGCGQRELVMQHNMHHVLQQLALQQHADQCCGHRIELLLLLLRCRLSLMTLSRSSSQPLKAMLRQLLQLLLETQMQLMSR